MKWMIFIAAFFFAPTVNAQTDSLVATTNDNFLVHTLTKEDSLRIADSIMQVKARIKDSLDLLPFVDSIEQGDFSISYDLSINAKSSTSIAETYNGGVKTVYVDKSKKVKIKFVSLMRMQTLLYNGNSTTNAKRAIILKSSGKSKYKFYLNDANWNYFNEKYKDFAFIMYNNDSLEILGKKTAKAVAILANGSRLTINYVPYAISPLLAKAEPILEHIPGIPLRYEFEKNDQRLVFLATDVSFLPFSKKEFAEPAKGYALKRFVPGTQVTKMVLEEEPIGPDDEE